MEHQKQVPEPLWRGGLSIAQLCVDRDTAIHEMSNQHDSYNQYDTDKKASETKGPYTCSTFDDLRPGGCKDCKHKGKFGSPIVLGKEIIEATEEDNTITTVDSNSKDVRVYNIPAYPFPFFRGKYGGIYRRGDPNKTEEEGNDKLVYENDFYVVKRMRDPEIGEVALFRLHLPHDGVREFSISTMAISSPDELRKQLAHNGVVAHKSQYESLARFVV